MWSWKIYYVQKKLNMEWQIMLALNLLLVTLHGRFTIGIEQDKQNWTGDTKYNI